MKGKLLDFEILVIAAVSAKKSRKLAHLQSMGIASVIAARGGWHKTLSETGLFSFQSIRPHPHT